MNNQVNLPDGKMSELEEKAKFFKTAVLDEVEFEGEELVDPESLEEEQGAAFKKAVLEKLGFNLGIYPDKSTFLSHIQSKFSLSRRGNPRFTKSFKIIRDTLNVGGKFVNDKMEVYLEQNNVELDEEGQLVLLEDGRIKGYFQSSHLKAANITPRHLYFKISEGLLPKKDRGKHFDLGEALHACLMEPTRFGRYVSAPIDPMTSHDGMDVHIAFWKEKLLAVMVAEEGNTMDGKKNYDDYLKSVREELNILSWDSIIEFMKGIKGLLLDEMEFISHGHRFNNLVQRILDLHEKSFSSEDVDFADKKGNDPFKIALKELRLKKNEALGESKKEPFNASIKENLLHGMIEACTQYITDNQENQSECFRNLAEKKTYLDIITSRTDLESVTQDQYLIIKALELNARSYGNGIIYQLAKHAHRECSAYLDDFEGLPLKVRPDMIQFAENIGVDAVISVKSTSSPNIEKFFYDNAKYQYELSEGMYQEVLSRVTGREFRSTITIMYQTVEPYGVAVFWWKPEDLELGRHKFLQAAQTLKETIEHGIWPGYDVYAEEGDFGVIDFQLPWWSAKGLEERNQQGMASLHPTGDIE